MSEPVQTVSAPAAASAPGSDEAEPAAPASRTIAKTAVRASAWVIGGYFGGQALRLAGNLILTRILFPSVFGLATLVTVFLTGLVMFSDVGTGPAIVQSPRGDDPRFLNTAWTIACARGLLLWAVAAALARPVAAFFGEPLLASVLPVAGAVAALGGFESTGLHSAQRHLRAERVAVIELVAQAVSILGIIALTFAWRSIHGKTDLTAIWAVIGGSILSAVARLVLTHTVLPGIRNRLDFERAAAKLLFGFGRWVFVSTILTFLAGQSDRVLLGKLVPLAVLGVYGIAANLAQLAVQAVAKIGHAVLFPAYSRLEAAGELRDSFRRARMPVVIVGAAVASGFIACGPGLIRVMYDARYHEAGWMLQFLAAGAWFQVLETINTSALLAQGRLNWMAGASAAKLVGLAVFVPLGMHFGGFAGALVGLLGSDVLKYLVSAVATTRRGLHGLRQDVAFTLAVVLISAAGAAVGGRVAAASSLRVAELAGSFAVAGPIWAAVILIYLRSSEVGRAVLARLSPGLRARS